jgi:hypothetical protein
VTVYFLSGLGADERVFQKLKLPQEWKVKHLSWLNTLENENLTSYCSRLSKLIDTREEFALIGLSLGGIVATELSKIVQPKIIIIISGISTKYELPAGFKILGWLKLNKIVPDYFLNKTYPFTYWFFGTKTSEEKLLLREIIINTSPEFLKWAINEILYWRNTQRPDNLFHIHGTKDKIFPCKKVKADIKIKNGGHFMVYSHAPVVSKLLREKIRMTNNKSD